MKQQGRLDNHNESCSVKPMSDAPLEPEVVPEQPRKLLSGGHDPRTMTLMVLDEATGFLQSPRHDGLTGLTKLNIVNIYRQTGNLTEACRSCGVEPRAIRWHCANDPAYKQAIDEAREQICDKAEGHIVGFMSEQRNFLDRMAWLKRYRPEWRETTEVNVNHSLKLVKDLADKTKDYHTEP